MRIQLIAVATFAAVFFATVTVLAQWGPMPRIPKHNNEITNEGVLDRLNDIESVVKGANASERKELIHRLVYAQVAMADATGTIENLSEYGDEISEAQRLQFYSGAARSAARQGNFMAAWECVESVREQQLKGNSSHSVDFAICNIVREMIKQDDIEAALERLNSEIILDNEKFEWQSGSRGKQTVYVNLVKKLGRDGKIQKAVDLIKSRFAGVDTHDHLLWDLATNCKLHGIEKSIYSIEQIVDPEIAGSVTYRMLNRKLEFHEWQSLFGLFARIRGPALALDSIVFHGDRYSGIAPRMIPILQATLQQVPIDKRSRAAKSKLFYTRLLAGHHQEAFESLDGIPDPFKEGQSYFNSLENAARTFGLDSDIDAFDEMIPFVESTQLRFRVYQLYFKGLIQSNRPATARTIVDTYAKLALAFGHDNYKRIAKSLLRIDAPESARHLCEAAECQYLLANYYFENDEKENALAYLEKNSNRVPILIESATVLFMHNQYDKAVETMERVPNDQQERAARQVFLELVSKGCAGHALELVRRQLVKKTSPGWPDFEAGIFSKLYEPRNPDSSLAETKELLELLSNQEKAIQVLAWRLAKNGSWNSAVETMQSVDGLSQADWETFFQMFSPHLESCEDKIISLAMELAEQNDWDSTVLMMRVLEWHVGHWLEAHRDKKALALVDLVDDPKYRTEILTTIAWGLNSRRKGYAINF